jgi:uncharacterized Ntn-hydrolase superfamily protein
MHRPRGFVRPILLCLVLLCAAPEARGDSAEGTFSIVAYDSVTQELGVAVQSKYFNVGTAVPWAEAGVGAVATQATVNMSFGKQALAMLGSGLSAEETLRALAATDSLWDSRQVGIVDARGRAVSWTGKRCLDWAGGMTGRGFACQGNILAGPAVVDGMARAFEQTRGELSERLIAALEAAQAAGGDKRGQQSAALLVTRPSGTHPEFRERYVDLQVEDHKAPIQELRRIWQIFEGFHGAGRHLQYASEFDAAGRRELAELERNRVGETLRRALARKEPDASLLNGLAWSCATGDIFLEEAREAADRAARLEPRNIDILDTLAEVYYRIGNPTKAIEVESRAATIDPKSQYLKDQLARFREAVK